jgi:dimethylhistidine N-methyltransferase
VADTPCPNLIDLKPGLSSMHDAVVAGLTARPKSLPPWLFYDAHGSRLFERICSQPEYYPTRTELSILRMNGAAIADALGEDCTLVELGSGSHRKAGVMLRLLRRPAGYVAIDVSMEPLREAVTTLAREFPRLPVTGICADFGDGAARLPLAAPGRRLVGFFPGSTVGNMTPAQAEVFLRGWAGRLRGGAMLVGVDLVKDAGLLHAAYNDAAGVTAAFNRNMLAHVRRALDTDIDPALFDHRAFFDPAESRIEMHLVARTEHIVRIGRRHVDFARGESIHTENSYKYTVDGFQALARRAGFTPRQVWTDPRGWFSVHCLEAPGG